MSYRKLTVAALITAGILVLPALTGTAVAADLDGPAYGDAPPPIAEQKVEFGSGWYIRGDIGVNQSYAVDGDSLPNANEYYAGIRRTQDAGYDLSLGGGYALTNGFRGDITADFHQPSETVDESAYCVDSTTQGCIFKGHFKPYDALANVYYDFGHWGVVSPYVGAGAGVAFGELSSSLTGGASNYGGATGYHQFAWALMAGVSIDIYDHTKLDVGYRYIDNGSIYGTHLYGDSIVAANTRLYYQEIRAGIRYMIDN